MVFVQEVSVWVGSVHRGLCAGGIWGSLSRERGLCPGEGVSAQGRGSLSRGRGLCPGEGSLQQMGSLFRGGVCIHGRQSQSGVSVKGRGLHRGSLSRTERGLSPGILSREKGLCLVVCPQGLCSGWYLEVSVQGRGSLEDGVSVQGRGFLSRGGGLCPGDGVSVQGRGSLFRGGGLCPGEGVSIQGRGLCPGDGVCPGE